MLTDEQRIFFQAAPDFEKFQAESEEFCEEVKYFLAAKENFESKIDSIALLLKDRVDNQNAEIAIHANLLPLLPPRNLYD